MGGPLEIVFGEVGEANHRRVEGSGWDQERWEGQLIDGSGYVGCGASCGRRAMGFVVWAVVNITVDVFSSLSASGEC